jgi:hypothetical protein
MNFYKIIMFAAIVVAGVAMTYRESHSQVGGNDPVPAAGKWSHVQVVTYASGLTGFFDTSDGKLYLYASDVKSPSMTVQLENLGQPLRVLRAGKGSL